MENDEATAWCSKLEWRLMTSVALVVGQSRNIMKRLLEHVARAGYRALMPKDAKNTLRLWLMLEEQDKPPLFVTEFSGGPVLVLAPHMDDETIGCGGTIRKHVMAGTRVVVVYMTDGRKGDSSLGGQGLSSNDLETAQQSLVAQRKDEARRAAGILGIHETLFLDRPDGQLEADAKLAETLGRILSDLRPGVVYLPSVLDAHRDHWATNLVFDQVMRGSVAADRWNLICRGYEVWTPLFPNRVVDVSDVFEVKIRALQQFESQNRHTDYVHITKGLNAYRSMFGLHGHGFVESFFEGTVQQHTALIKRLKDKKEAKR